MAEVLTWSLAELASRFGLEVRGEPTVRISGLQTLQSAGPEHLSFLANRKYLEQLDSTRAAAVIVHPSALDRYRGPALVTEQPYLAYARISRMVESCRHPVAQAEIHPQAVVAPTAQIEDEVRIGPMAVIGEHAVLKRGVVIDAGAIIGDRVELGEDSHVFPRVVIYSDCVLGKRVRIHAGAVIGSDGFGFAPGPDGWERIAQLGRVVIGDDCDIGANTTIDRGALGDTQLGQGVIVDNQVQIAHNVVVGDGTAIAACVGISGSTRIGRRCVLAGGVGLVGHIHIADQVQLTGMTMVTKSIEQPGSYSSGSICEPTSQWKKTAVRVKQLERLVERVTRLERRIQSDHLS